MIPRSPRFATTSWTMVLAARDPNAPGSRAALETLCRTYWFPLYAYARRSGLAPHDAEDATQTFFVRLPDKAWLTGADREKGRFRTFLAVAMKHFLANERDRMRAAKRGGGDSPLPLDAPDAEERFLADTAAPPDPDAAFEHRWARTLLDRVVASLRDDYERAGNLRDFDALKPYLAAGRGEIPYATISGATGLSEGAARVAVSRMRKRFREIFRDAVAETVADPADIEAEMRHVARVLAS